MRRFLLFLLALGALVPLRSDAQAVMRSGDVFELRLSGMPLEYASEFALQYTVGDTGAVTFPLIGEMKAAGATTTDFARAIERKLVAERIFTKPTAVIALRDPSLLVRVTGLVRVPQSLPWNEGMTLSNAITRTGDFQWRASGTVKLIRDRKLSYYNLSRAEKDPAQNPKLLPGDEIIVPE